jgi:hypothetical protein
VEETADWRNVASKERVIYLGPSQHHPTTTSRRRPRSQHGRVLEWKGVNMIGRQAESEQRMQPRAPVSKTLHKN